MRAIMSGMSPQSHDGFTASRVTRLLRFFMAPALLTGGVLVAGITMTPGTASAQPTTTVTATVSFTAPGCTTWNVPDGVTSVDIGATGAAGSSGSTGSQSGGAGDGVSATLDGLSGGQTLNACVDVGGALGGGDGFGGAGTGGGASGVSIGSTFADPVVVAGGGGGAGDGNSLVNGGNWGNAGSTNSNGGGGYNGAGGGTGGSGGGGGGGGNSAPSGANGSSTDSSGPGVGGTGGSAVFGGGGGGGGGGGYVGGGGGGGAEGYSGAGGGGGSDYCAGASPVSSCDTSPGMGTQTVAGGAAGDAQVVLTYTAPALDSITITSTAPSATVGGPTYTPTATAASGDTVVITSATTSVCTISSGVVSFLSAGTCTLDFNDPGNSTYAAAPQVNQGFTVDLDSNSTNITSTAPSATVGGPTYTPTATAASGDTVVITSATTLVCTISSGVVSFLSAGTCTLDFNDPGNSTYAAAPQVNQGFTVDLDSQTTTFTAPASGSVGGSANLSATGGGSGNPVVFSVDPASGPGVCKVSGTNGTTLNYTGAGTCVIDANQAGDTTYATAPQVTGSTTVTLYTLPPPPPSCLSPPTDSTIVAGQELCSTNQAISASNGQYELILQSDGNLVIYFSGRAIWDTGTQGNPGDYMIMQSDGNLVIYSASGGAIWSSGTGGHPTDSPYAIMQTDGNFVIYKSSGGVLYASNTVQDELHDGQSLSAGQFLRSPSYADQLIMQSDGNLVIYNPGAVWDTATNGHRGAYTILQGDGNFVIYSDSRAVLFETATNGNPGDYLIMQSDGNFVIYSSANVALWSSKIGRI